MKRSGRLAAESPKRRAAREADGRPAFSTLARGKRIRPRNPEKQAEEFARCFHSLERVEFVRSLPCAATGRHGSIDNAHIKGSGVGRRAHYTSIIPLSRALHRKVHRWGWSSVPELSAEEVREYVAALTEQRWQAELARRGGEA